jgi:putative MATE family efflux protein
MIDMARVERISSIAFPIIAGAVAMNVMSLIDAAMVGQLGDQALGGVGIAGQVFFLFLATLLGLAAGVQAIVARRVGEERLEVTGKILNSGILVATAAAAVLMLVAYFTSLPLFSIINSDPSVIDQGTTYLDLRIPSLLFVGISIAFRAYWVGVSMAKYVMISVAVTSVANVILNYILIFGHLGFPRMEVAGAGLGSTLATLMGLLVHFAVGFKHAVSNGFMRGLPPREQTISLVKISYPESVRQIAFCISVVLFYVLIGRIGTQELAAFHIVITISLLAYLPITGMGQAATTLVSEALGRKNYDDASAWGWQVSGGGFAVLTVLSLLVIAFPEPVLGLFLVDEETLALAVFPLQLGLLGHVIEGYSRVLGSSLVGAGATKLVMYLGFGIQWLFFLPLLAVSVALGYRLDAAMWVFLAYGVLSAVVFTFTWQRGGWQQIEI